MLNRSLVDPIANAVLYEGFILYPYRPSTKNRQRWTFGGLYPEPYCRNQTGDAFRQQTECLVLGSASTVFEAVVRFLHLTARDVAAIDPPIARLSETETNPLAFREVEILRIGATSYHTWQEAEEREVNLGSIQLGDLIHTPQHVSVSFAGGRRLEPLHQDDGPVVGALIREQSEIFVDVDASAVEVEPGLYRVRLSVSNRTPLSMERGTPRDDAPLRCLASTHAILGVNAGRFVSLTDPRESCREAASACENVGTWPVLVGEQDSAALMLSAPIILEDYPQVAPESQGDCFDGTEMDEMLALRIMTLTDLEKDAMTSLDPRTRALLARIEAMGRDDLLSLHGTIRSPRTLPNAKGGQSC